MHTLPLSGMDSAEFNTLLIIMVSLLGFLVYWFFSISDKAKQYFLSRSGLEKGALRHILAVKFSGLLFMGILPLLVFSVSLSGFRTEWSGLIPDSAAMAGAFRYFLLLLLVLLPLIYLNAGKPDNIIHYPQLRTPVWNGTTALLYALGWAVYLFGYELLFRGVLLFGLADSIGFWPAIAVNMALYSATHLPKGAKETYGAIPLGFIMCLLTIASGSIWFSFAAHLCMALTNSFTALRKNPAFKLNF